MIKINNQIKLQALQKCGKHKITYSSPPNLSRLPHSPDRATEEKSSQSPKSLTWVVSMRRQEVSRISRLLQQLELPHLVFWQIIPQFHLILKIFGPDQIRRWQIRMAKKVKPTDSVKMQTVRQTPTKKAPERGNPPASHPKHPRAKLIWECQLILIRPRSEALLWLMSDRMLKVTL